MNIVGVDKVSVSFLWMMMMMMMIVVYLISDETFLQVAYFLIRK